MHILKALLQRSKQRKLTRAYERAAQAIGFSEEVLVSVMDDPDVAAAEVKVLQLTNL